MESVNHSAMLGEALAKFSKAAYQIFGEVEMHARLDVAQSLTEARGANAAKDGVLKQLHASQLEVQSLKQEVVASKAALSQTELTITHQAETLAAQSETIAQLRREVTQWKDQSRNWQEHFLRVEQERCAQSSRLDELVVEKLSLPHKRTGSSSLFTPKSSKYTNGVNSAPSTTSRKTVDPSPTQKSAAQPCPSDQDTIVVTPRSQTRPKRAAAQQEPDHSPEDVEEIEETSTPKKRLRKSRVTETSASKRPEQPTVRSSTVIRRVHAIVTVKQEDDSADESQDVQASSSSAMKKKEESTDHQRYLRTPRIMSSGDEDEEEDEIVEEEAYVPPALPVGGPPPRRQLVTRKARMEWEGEESPEEHDQQAEEDEEEDDELMMGAKENTPEVAGAFGTLGMAAARAEASAQAKRRDALGAFNTQIRGGVYGMTTASSGMGAFGGAAGPCAVVPGIYTGNDGPITIHHYNPPTRLHEAQDSQPTKKHTSAKPQPPPKRRKTGGR